MPDTDSWRPTASVTALRRRAQALRRLREFFHARNVLEVETPAMVNAPVSDVNLGSVRVTMPGMDTPLFLHTSPEYAMKRLLAAGSGDIYQICRVFRGAERGRQHNPEFTMLEWYRTGFSLEDLMREVADLARELLAAPHLAVEFVSYREAVRQHAGFDPLEAPIARVAGRRARPWAERRSRSRGRPRRVARSDRRRQGRTRAGSSRSLTFLHRYPASQAALARLDADDPRVALRFELYHRGVELANGYHELASGAEQRQRFSADQQTRAARGLPTFALDANLLSALDAGLPDCAGVALGFDRVLMLAHGRLEHR